VVQENVADLQVLLECEYMEERREVIMVTLHHIISLLDEMLGLDPDTDGHETSNPRRGAENYYAFLLSEAYSDAAIEHFNSLVPSSSSSSSNSELQKAEQWFAQYSFRNRNGSSDGERERETEPGDIPLTALIEWVRGELVEFEKEKEGDGEGDVLWWGMEQMRVDFKVLVGMLEFGGM